MMYSAYKLNKQGENIQPWLTPFPIFLSVSPIISLFQQKASLSLLSLSLREQIENQNHRKLIKLIKGPHPCLTQGNYEPCPVGPHIMDGSWWRVLTKCGPVEKGVANHFSTLALRTAWTVWKGKKIGQWKMNFPGRQVLNMLLEKSGEIDQERKKRLRQSKNTTQLWIWLVIQVKSDAVKSNIT